MSVPAARSVSYLPGRWTALVTGRLCVLGDLHLSDPQLAASWVAGGAVGDGGDGGVAAVLAVLARPGQERAPSFVLVARAGDALRLVVAGRAHAEVFAGQQDPVVYSATDERTWLDERLDPALDVRLVADDATPFERISPLPLTAGIVLASYVFSTGVAAPPAAAPGQQHDAAGWIPPPMAQPSQDPIPPDRPIRQDWPAEPAPQLSGVFRALPWRSSLVDPDDGAPLAAWPVPAEPALDGSGDTGADDASDVAPEPVPAPQPAPLQPVDKPSFGAPGYEPPPFGAEAFEQDYAYPPPLPYRSPTARQPEPAVSSAHRPPPPPESGAPPAPLVQAVHCTEGHVNPLHIDACRVCGAGFAPQQPVTVERPPLGVLRLPTGEAVPLDRDAVLGRAPFAVDQRAVRLVEVASPDNDISRSHVRITLDGWQVFATDLGSTNGTAVTLPGRPASLLRAHDPFALAPGAVLSLADEADVRFESC